MIKKFFLGAAFFLSLFYIFSKVTFAQGYADLVLTGFDTCWETYNDNGTTKWKAWTWLKVKNQGNVAGGPFQVSVAYGGCRPEDNCPAGSWRCGPWFFKYIYFNASLAPGETQTKQDWIYASKEAIYYPGVGNWCAGNGVMADCSGYSGTFCTNIISAAVDVDILDEVYEGPKDETIYSNNYTIQKITPYPNSLVPGYPGRSCSAIPTPTPTKIYLNYEAEAGAISSPMTKVRNTKSSNCYYLHSPEGSGHGKGYVTLNVDIPQSGYYVVFGRVNGTGWSSDSFYLSWDNGAEINWPIPHGWQWNRANNNGTPKNWNLTKGKHILKIRTREDWSQIDTLVVTNNYNYQPTYFKACK
jgi:hypothetical protein